MALPQHPANHIVIVVSELDDLHGFYDRGVATITNERAIADFDEGTAITIRHGGVGDFEVTNLVNGADDGVIVIEGETMVIVKQLVKHTRPIDIDVITVVVKVDADIVAASTCSKYLQHVAAMPRVVAATGLQLNQRKLSVARAQVEKVAESKVIRY